MPLVKTNWPPSSWTQLERIQVPPYSGDLTKDGNDAEMAWKSGSGPGTVLFQFRKSASIHPEESTKAKLGKLPHKYVGQSPMGLGFKKWENL